MAEHDLFSLHLSRRSLLKLGSSLSLAMGITLFLPETVLAAAPEAGKMVPPKAPVPIRKPRAPKLLMIDPGHGGHDPGAIGRSGLQEKDVTLDIARRMAEAFASQQDLVKARLTRSGDDFLALPDRVRLTQEARADFFISIHADSAPSKLARGLSAYTLSEKASDEFAKALAKQENRVEAMGGIDLGETDKEVAAILMDLTARRTRNTSQRAKVSFIQAMGRQWRLLERPMRSANFAVLRAPDVPSVLVETGFLSNPQDEALLNQPLQRQKIARVMAKELTAILTSPLFA